MLIIFVIFCPKNDFYVSPGYYVLCWLLFIKSGIRRRLLYSDIRATIVLFYLLGIIVLVVIIYFLLDMTIVIFNGF